MRAYYNDIDPYCCAVLRKQINLGNLPKGDVDEQDIRTVRGANLVGYGHVHLFAGIGGFPLGLARAGVPSDWRILTGGFPCQDISLAGQGAGLEGEQSGLWWEMYRLICESLACGMGFEYILVENVAALANRGLPAILGALSEVGYDAEWLTLRACDFGAPHIRERLFLVAYLPGIRGGTWRSESERQQRTPNTYSHDTPNVEDANQLRYSGQESAITSGQRSEVESASIREWEDRTRMADPGSTGRQELNTATITAGPGHVAWRTSSPGNGNGLVEDSTIRREWIDQESRGESRTQSLFEQSGTGHAQPRICRVLDGLSDGMDRTRWPNPPGYEQAEWEPSRVTQEKVSNRVARLKALGNSIVPQCAEYIGRQLLQALESEDVE